MNQIVFLNFSVAKKFTYLINYLKKYRFLGLSDKVWEYLKAVKEECQLFNHLRAESLKDSADKLE